MKIAIYFAALWLTAQTVVAQDRITPSDVFAQAVQIEKEISLFKRHLSISDEKLAPELKAGLRPRHSWQKSYLILAKINIFRRKKGLPVYTVLSCIKY